ncbi:MAG: WG repeat-containing protein [Cytophagaceae bacterium]|jgi:hypothetical protein|nr:WG repeat-containing protein [Cytophagaceae bacterium]
MNFYLRFLFAFIFFCSLRSQSLPCIEATGWDGGKIKIPDSLKSKRHILFKLGPDSIATYGLISGSGKILSEPIYDSLVWLSETSGFFSLQKNLPSHWNWQRLKGDLVLKAPYQSLQAVSGGVLATPVVETSKKNRPEWYDLSGNRLQEPTYDSLVLSGNFVLTFLHGEANVYPSLQQAPLVHVKKINKETVSFFPRWHLSNTSRMLFADSLRYFNDSTLLVQRGDVWGGMDTSLQVKIPFVFTSIIAVDPVVLGKRDDGFAGMLRNGEWIFEKADTAWIDTKHYIHWKKANRHFIAHRSGKSLRAEGFEDCRTLCNSLLAARENNLWGYWHVQGKWQIPPKYAEAFDFKHGYALVKTPAPEAAWALADRNDSVFFRRMDAVMYYHGFLQYKTCSDSMYAGEPSWELHYPFPPYRYEAIEPWVLGYFKTRNGTLVGALNKQGKEIVYCHQDTLFDPDPEDHYFFYKRTNGSIGISDSSGSRTLYTTFRFPQCGQLKNGMCRFQENGLFGFFDIYGNIRISAQYPSIEEFSHQAVAVMLKGKWGYLDRNEKIIIQPYYSLALPAQKGFAIASQGKKWEFISTRTGQRINTSVYDRFQQLPSGNFLVWKGKKVGLTSPEGKEIFSPKYDCIVPMLNHWYAVNRDGNYGVLDAQENLIINFQHIGILCHEPNKHCWFKTLVPPIALPHENRSH